MKKGFTVFTVLLLVLAAAVVWWLFQWNNNSPRRALQRADALVQKRMDALDLSDKSSVMELMRALDQMKSDVVDVYHNESGLEDEQGVVTIDQAIRRVRIPEHIEGGTIAVYSKDRNAGVIWRTGGDSYCLYFFFEDELIGLEAGYSSGQIGFSGCLPDWENNPAGEERSILGGREITRYREGYSYADEKEYALDAWQKAHISLDQ